MIEKRKAIFIDKDGTIIPDIPYNVNPDLITIYDGVIEGLKLLQQQGFVFIIISNQAGVARGYFKYSELDKVKNKINQIFNSEGIQIENFYFCPHHTEGKIAEYSIKCNCRKPEPGMILKASLELQIDTKQSWMIGDILNDVEAGNRAGCRTVLINNKNETEWVMGAFREPTFIASDFLAAAKIICNNAYETSGLNDKKLAGV